MNDDSTNTKSLFKTLRPFLSLAVILLTCVMFFVYFSQNPDAIQQIRSVGWVTVLKLLVLYGMVTAVLAVIYQLMVKICETSIGFKENFMLTAYSSIANFFGPLQSGPGVRMAYLKKKHQLSLKKYFLVTLFYYACFAVISAIFFLTGIAEWWIILLGGVVTGLICKFAINSWERRHKAHAVHLKPTTLAIFVGLVFLQLSLIAIIYAVELHSLGYNVGVRQVLTYTGTANFALFISLTPGALGFREAFLVFTKNLTGLDNTAILTTNLLDRVVYVVFLGLLFVFILIVLGRSRLRALKGE